MKRPLAYLLVTAAAMVVFIRSIHSFLAVQEPIGAPVVVVEGWLTDPQLQEAARIITERNAAHVYTTGTIRPFAHYLGNGDTLVVRLSEPFSGQVSIEVAGVEGGGFTLLADGAPLIRGMLTNTHQEHKAETPGSVRVMAITTDNEPGRGMAMDNMFIRDLRIGGTNAHHLANGGGLRRANGERAPLTPTHAAHARHRLASLGVPREKLSAIPVYGRPLSRSWSSAAHFAQQAAKDGVHDFDLITMGVHGRRSRFIYQRACGNGCEVGVITLEDHVCPPQGWWKSHLGWFLVMKEVASLPVVLAIATLR